MSNKLPIVLGILVLGTAPIAWWPDSRGTQVDTSVATVIGTKVAPDQVANLRVVTWDETSKAAQILEITRSNGVWTIPSHFDFPADGNTRVTKVAAGFLGVDRGRMVTDDPKEHESLEVLDPMDEANLTRKGHGKRVTMKDQGGSVVLDLIVGKYVENAQGLYYVREVGKNEVYTAKVEPYDLSTRFTDYVQTDPFKLDRDEVYDLSVKDYSVNLQANTVEQRSETRFDRLNKDGPWVSLQAPNGKRAKKETVDAILGELTGLHLTGVRPYQSQWMQPCGFYPGADKNLYGSEGGLVVTTRQGLRYELYLGQVTSDADESEPPKPTAAGGSTVADVPEAKKGSNRYLLLVVRYDPKLDEDVNAVKAAGSDTIAAGLAQKRVDANKAKAEKLQKRFLQYFYVISDDSFKRLRPAQEALFEDLPPEPMAGNTGKTNKAWLADKAKEEGIVATGSGLLYQVLTSGPADGPHPTNDSAAEVMYRGTLVDGSEFDATKDSPATFRVNAVVKGWTEALKLMRPGDKWRLYIPPELGYGEAGSPPKIPANAILCFDVELKSIK